MSETYFKLIRSVLFPPEHFNPWFWSPYRIEPHCRKKLRIQPETKMRKKVCWLCLVANYWRQTNKPRRQNIYPVWPGRRTWNLAGNWSSQSCEASVPLEQLSLSLSWLSSSSWQLWSSSVLSELWGFHVFRRGLGCLRNTDSKREATCILVAMNWPELYDMRRCVTMALCKERLQPNSNWYFLYPKEKYIYFLSPEHPRGFVFTKED